MMTMTVMIAIIVAADADEDETLVIYAPTTLPARLPFLEKGSADSLVVT